MFLSFWPRHFKRGDVTCPQLVLRGWLAAGCVFVSWTAYPMLSSRCGISPASCAHGPPGEGVKVQTLSQQVQVGLRVCIPDQ